MDQNQNPNPNQQNQAPNQQYQNPNQQYQNPNPNQQYNQYNQYNVYQNGMAPVGQISTTRGLLKYILLSIITCGIYSLVVMSSISSEINTIASRYDGKKTMHFCLLAFIIAPITCGIATFVWYHRISERIGNELRRRGIFYSFGASDYWLWSILGSLIFVGPFIYMHKLFKAMNLLAGHYNVNG